MSKLLAALILSATTLTVFAEPIFSNEDAAELCAAVTSDPMLQAQVKIYVQATAKGMSNGDAWTLAAAFNGIIKFGEFIPVKTPMISRYIIGLDDVKDYDQAMLKVAVICEKVLTDAK